jgi:hypothetical protein
MSRQATATAMIALAALSSAQVALAQCEGAILEPHNTPSMRFTSPVVMDPDGPGPRAGVLYALGVPQIGPPTWATFDGSMWSTKPGTPPGLTSVPFDIRAVTLGEQLFTSDLWRYDGTTWTRINLATDGSVLTVRAMAVHQGEVVIYASTPTLGRALFRWTGSAWSLLTPAVTAGNSSWHISSRIQLVSDGASLYVLDNMATMNGVTAPGIARWDGSTWSTLGGGIGGQIRTARIINGQLFVGGGFLSEGTNVRGSIRRWTGSAWQFIEPTGTTTSSLLVNDLIEVDGKIIVMGQINIGFTGPTRAYGAIDLATNTITPFSGNTITNLESFAGMARLGNRTIALAIITNNGGITPTSVCDEVFATSSVPLRSIYSPDLSSARIQGGRPIFQPFGITPGDFLEYAEGAWQLRNTVNPSLLEGFDFENQTYRFLRITNTSTWSIEQLQGSTWVPLGQPVNFQPVRFARLGSNLAVHGSAGSSSVTVRWNGTDWESFLAPVSGSVREMIFYKGDPYAIGSIQSPNGALWFLRWDGTQWVRVGQGIETINSQAPADIHVDPQNRLWIVGPIARTIGATTTSVAMVIWDGVALTGYAGPNSTGVYDAGAQSVALGAGTSRLSNSNVFSYQPFTQGAFVSTPLPAFGNEVHGTMRFQQANYSARIALDGQSRIFRQPQDTAVACGQTAELSLTATSGLAGQTYQWRKDGAPLTDTPLAITTGPIIEGATRARLRLINATTADAGTYTCDVISACNTVTSTLAVVTVTNCTVLCDSIDFNNNQVFPEDQDVIDFFTVLSGGPCSAGNTCSDIDFNNNQVFPEDQDVIDFFTVLAGGSCPA